jgi:hypothetical protein
MNFLNKEYTKYNSENKSWKNGLFSATVLLSVFLLFQPFGFRDKDIFLKLTLYPSYSIFAYFYSVANFLIVRRILKSKKIWTLKNELVSFLIGMFPVTFLVLLLSSFIAGDMPINLFWYFKLFYHVSSLYLVISIGEFFYYNNKSADIKIEHLSSQVQLVLQQFVDKRQASDSETISLSLEKDSIDINRNKLIFVKSIGNYLEFYFRENDGQIKKLIKRGRIHQAENDLKAFPEFLRCHRAYIVNLKQAIQIKGNIKNARLVFDPKLEEIPVSRSQFKILKEQLDKIIAA